MFGSKEIKCMSANKLLILVNHHCDRRTSKKIDHWINKLSEYDYLSYISYSALGCEYLLDNFDL